MYNRMGPYELAEAEFHENRDTNLWIACLANNNQAHNKAKSQYIKEIANLIILEEKQNKINNKIREEKIRIYDEDQEIKKMSGSR